MFQFFNFLNFNALLGAKVISGRSVIHTVECKSPTRSSSLMLLSDRRRLGKSMELREVETKAEIRQGRRVAAT